MRCLLLVCASLLFPTAALLGQADNQQRFRVTGSVVNESTGEPMRGAMVEFQQPSARSTMTDSAGHFEIDDLVAGNAIVTTKRPGFRFTNGQQRITIGSSTAPVTLKLAPLSKISGRVTDRDGEPIDGVQIQCSQIVVIDGRRMYTQMPGASTDETGQFLIEDLPPGTYVVRTSEKQLYFGLKPKAEASRYIYPATYYPDTTSRDTAQQIELAPGADGRVDMELRSIRAAHVSVTVTPGYANLMGFLNDNDGNSALGAAMSDGSGVVTFGAVPPGNWKILLRAFSHAGGRNDEALSGELAVDVGTTDIDNLKLQLSKPTELQVTASGIPNPQVYVQLFSPKGPAGGAAFQQNNDVKISVGQSGSYRVVARTNGSSCVTSVTSGSQDLLREWLLITSGNPVPPIQIVESDNCPSLTVTPNMTGSATVLVTSALPGLETRQAVASKGPAVFSGLTPGEYQVYAFDNVNTLEYANPDVMRNFKSQSVTLEAGDKKSLQVEVNERTPR